MADSARILITAAVLSASAIAVFAWRLTRTDPSQPERLVGELRLTQFGAVILAVTAGAWIGLGTAHPSELMAGLDVSFGIAYALLAVIALHLELRQSLLLLAAAFVLHALIDIGHRPGLLSTTLAPRWFIVGCAAYNVFMGAICYWARRR